MEIEGIDWFNISAPNWSKTYCPRLFGKTHFIRFHVCLWNLFNRVSDQGHYWGIGVLQLGRRHLFYVGHELVSVLFINWWRRF